MRTAPATLLALALLLPAAGEARAQAVLEDAVDVQVIGRDVFAITESGRRRIRLELDEKVESHRARGRVGLVVTNRRLLAASPDVGGWAQVDRLLAERPMVEPLVSGRLALFVSNRRALGFVAGRGRWFAEPLAIQESIVEIDASQGSIVLVTSWRAIGFGPELDRFASAPFRLAERIESVNAVAGAATVRTSQRVLVFSAQSGTWSEEILPLDAPSP